MSWMPCADPDMDSHECPSNVEMVIIPRTHDIGGFEVQRALPFAKRRMVGPFIFWDQMGPGEFVTGNGIDVRPHPHIGLSTVTYLFKGTMDHKDSLGTDMRITPGDVNLMTAGKGIVHSERTGMDIREEPHGLFGIQSWLAQPKSHEQGDCAFTHIGKNDLPSFNDNGITGRVIMGEFHGLKSPAPMQWDTLYVDCIIDDGKALEIPALAEERALYLLEGQVEFAHVTYDSGRMLVLAPGEAVTLKAKGRAHLLILGGATMDGPRKIWWNFVASDPEILEQAKRDWQDKRFPVVPNDEEEFIPLPDGS